MICFCKTDADYLEARQLCSLCFGDEDEYLSGVFSRTKKEDLLLYKDGERIISLLFMLQFELGSRKGHYIYYACTHPEHRGKGLMTKLLDAAKTEGAGETHAAEPSITVFSGLG
jgi:GNAT superfamily N-acetyltransferase